MRFTNDEIETVKLVSIVAFLHEQGIDPAYKQGHQYVYHSPFATDKTPSFYVDEQKNVYKDFTTDEKGGDNINIVRRLLGLNFPDAVRRLQRVQLNENPVSFFLSGPLSETSEHNDRKIIGINSLKNDTLIKYVERTRGIPYRFAMPYVSEISYLSHDKRFYGVGFRNDADGWAIRSPNFKTQLGPQAITTLEVPGSPNINLFEGFFNFLSACVYFGTVKLTNTTVILNSNTMVGQAIERLQAANTVYYFGDNDNAGNKCLDRIEREGCSVIDRRTLYSTHNDFNLFLCR